MFPEFDPAVARVLDVVGRSLARSPGGVDVDAVTSALGAEDDEFGQDLSRDRSRVAGVLERLRADGLLEAEDGTSPTYRLTPLGQARITGAADED